MGNVQVANSDKLTAACNEAFEKFPKSCSHAVWYVIKQYKLDQKWMNANDLVANLTKNPEWKEVQLNELAALASRGILVVGGANEDNHGHVIVIYPGEEKTTGGYYFINGKTGKVALMRKTGSFARAMSTSKGKWPGAMSNGDKTVWDPWADDLKFQKVRFWKYIGPSNNGVSLLTPKMHIKKPAGATIGQKNKRQVKRLHSKTKSKAKESIKWNFKTVTDCFGAMNRKWQKFFH
jgi:hypothetical protein